MDVREKLVELNKTLNRRKPAKIKNQYGEWDYRNLPKPPKGD